ncbi:MAG: hypothetical protein QMB82_10400 [Bacteroidales bacterium]
MKYKRILLLLLVFLPFTTSLGGQEPLFSIRDNSFSFSFKNEYFVLTPDSLYSSIDGILWQAVPNTFGLRQMKLSFVEESTTGYLFHQSGGKIVTYDGSRFKEFHYSEESRNQYSSLPFIHAKTPHIFGGVGLFTHKNIIVYFDKLKRDWVKVLPKTPISGYPQARFNLTGSYTGDQLFVGPGTGVDEERESSESHQIQLNDFWRFDFITREWSLLGKLQNEIDLQKYHIINNYRDGALLLGVSDAYYFNMRDNKLYHYKSVDGIMLGEAANNFSIPVYVSYNNHSDKFTLLVLREDGYRMPLVVNSDRILGSEVTESNLYEPPLSKSIFLLAALLLLVTSIALYFGFKRRGKEKTPYEKVSNSIIDLEKTLTSEEFNILKMIINKHPDPVQFLDLMSMFDQKMSYESHKKRLRSSLLSLEDKVKKHLHTNADVFEITRSKEDRRNKQIKVKG